MEAEIEFQLIDGKCRAQICRQALYDQGWTELAGRVGTNMAGNPMRPPEALSPAQARAVAEAFAKVHEGNPDFVNDVEEHVALLQEPIDGPVRHWRPVAKVWAMWPDGAEYV
jgi:hypothetical protein